MDETQQLNWFKKELLPSLIKDGYFPEISSESKLEKCEFEDIAKGVDSFASAPRFAKLTLSTPTGHITKDIIIKFQCLDPIFREKMKLNLQFQNEVTVYNKILPGFAKFLTQNSLDGDSLLKIVPKCHFASETTKEPEKSIVILQDLRKEGFKPSVFMTDLDLDHCMFAFERLAEFHAVSYAMKFQNYEIFHELKNSFVDVWFEDNEWTRNQSRDFTGLTSRRGIDYLKSRNDSEVPLSYLEKLEKMLEPEGLFDLTKSLLSPQEPLAVICHGDFNRNNTLFKYNNDKVVDAKLIDFQTAMYGSPCKDLCFFVYMNTTLEFREKYFDKVFRHYHSTLIRRVAAITKESEKCIEDRYPFGAFEKEFGRLAITAYVTVAFFLPIMMAPTKADFEVDIKEKTSEQMARENYEQGGEVVSKRIADVIVDFYRRKFYT